MNDDPHSLIGDSSRKSADLATDLAVQSRELYEEFFRISLEQDPEYGQRASRIFFLASSMRPEWLDSMHSRVIEALPGLHNESVTRNFLHIYESLDLPEDEDLLGHLVAFCFDVIEKRNRSVAVDVYALSILGKVAKRIPELADELIMILNGRIDDEHAAVCARSRMILKQLKFSN